MEIMLNIMYTLALSLLSAKTRKLKLITFKKLVTVWIDDNFMEIILVVENIITGAKSQCIRDKVLRITACKSAYIKIINLKFHANNSFLIIASLV